VPDDQREQHGAADGEQAHDRVEPDDDRGDRPADGLGRRTPTDL
jgi:hypothetical protein